MRQKTFCMLFGADRFDFVVLLQEKNIFNSQGAATIRENSAIGQQKAHSPSFYMSKGIDVMQESLFTS